MNERVLRIGLIAFGTLNLALGALMTLAPGEFYEKIGEYGVENGHYIGDVGAFYVAAGVGLLLAVGRPSWRAPLLVVSTIWYGLHAVNHLIDIDEAAKEGRGIADTVLLVLGTLALAWLAREATRAEDGPPARQAPAPKGRRPDYPPGD